MANVNYYIKKNKGISSIYARLTHRYNIDVSSRTNLSVPAEFWDTKNKKVRKVLKIDYDFINKKLEEIKYFVLDTFNKDFTQGRKIDKNWLSDTILFFYGHERKSRTAHTLFFTDFCKWWMIEKAPTHKSSRYKLLSEVNKKYYKKFIQTFEEFENQNTRIKLTDLDESVIDKFCKFLNEEE